MSFDPASNALHDIRDNILLARSFVARVDLAEFQTSRFHFYAATRASR